jgi:adenylate cyclase
MLGSYNIKVRLRLISGLVLFVFLLSHLLNHGLGLVSLAAMEQGRTAFVAVWRSVPGTILLLLAFLVHVILGLEKVIRMPSWRMPRWEFVQIALGLLIPISLLPHATATRIAHELYAIDDTYAAVLLGLWSPWAVPQIVLVLTAWVHGCLGLHFWLRFRRGYAPLAPWLLGLAVLLPVLALLGFWNGGREVQGLAADPDWLAAQAAAGNWPPAEQQQVFAMLLLTIAGGTAALTAALLGARQIVAFWPRVRASVQIAYAHGPRVHVSPGTTVLEASRLARIPHASVCGGRGRCSTCRVRVDSGLELLPPASIDEQQVLRRVGAPPNVRLACQIRPLSDVVVTPLLPPMLHPSEVHALEPHRHGREMEIAIVFTDLRGFTRLTEQKLAYDVVFLLNLYFRTMGEVIEEHHGHLVQVFGDGIMALFGIGIGPEVGCRQALRAARQMAERLDALNREHPLDLGEPLRMGIGIHSGPVIVGEMGYHHAVILTAVGDAVNTTSRLQEATKQFGCQLVLSQRVAEMARVDLAGFPQHDLDVRGRSRSLTVRVLGSAHDLPEIPPDALPYRAAPPRMGTPLGR